MSLLSGAVVALALLVLVNLLLLTAVVRRLREHQVRLDGLHAAGPDDIEMLAAGERVGAFTAVGSHGQSITHPGSFVDRTMVGFFSPTCPPCHEQLPLFLEQGNRMPRVLSVVLDDPLAPQARDALLERLEAVGEVVVVQQQDPLVAAFRVSAYPAVFTVTVDGRVESSGHTVLGLAGLLTV